VVFKRLSDATILVECTVKGKIELIEFVLDKSTEKLEVGDEIRVSYLKKEGKNGIVMKVFYNTYLLILIKYRGISAMRKEIVIVFCAFIMIYL
jgi:hypothetical protein